MPKKGLRILLRFILIVVLFLIGKSVFAQDPQFTQFFNTPLYHNPAFAGTTPHMRISAAHRSQWLGIDAQFQTQLIGFEYYNDIIRSGFALQMIRDDAGKAEQTTTGITGQYSYALPFARGAWQLRLGAEIAYMDSRTNFDRLVFVSQVRDDEPDVWEGQSGTSASVFDVGAGLLVYNENFWAGAAVHHISQPNRSMFKGQSAAWPMRISAHLGGNIPVGTINGELYLQPAMLFRMQGPLMQADFGSRLGYELWPVSFGLFYRGIPFMALGDFPNSDSLNFTVDFKSGGLNIGYSYDLTLTQPGPYTGGSHEITLNYQIITQDRESSRYVRCPIYGKF